MIRLSREFVTTKWEKNARAVTKNKIGYRMAVSNLHGLMGQVRWVIVDLGSIHSLGCSCGWLPYEHYLACTVDLLIFCFSCQQKCYQIGSCKKAALYGECRFVGDD